jgi:ribosome biogenesis protein MAK21
LLSNRTQVLDDSDQSFLWLLVTMAEPAAARKTPKRRRGRGGDRGGGGSSPDEPSKPGGGSSANKAPPPQRQHNKSLLIQLRDDEPTWFQYGSHLPGRNATLTATAAKETSEVLAAAKKRKPPSSDQPSAAAVAKHRALADEIYRAEVQLAAKKPGGGRTADDRWVESTVRGGTLKDRIAAMSVLASSDPVHKLHALDGLLQLAGCHVEDHSPRQHPQGMMQQQMQRSKPNSRVAHLAAQALEDLFLHALLPKDRKLVPLDRRPLHLYADTSGGTGGGGGAKNATTERPSLSPRVLLLWRVEEMVRDRYRAFVSQYLSRTLRDPGLDVDKKFCLRVASNLLRSAPEGESQLLQLLADKLGDPSRAVSSSAARELQRVLGEHPAMRTVVAREVQQLAHRPNLSARALYGCAAFLSQLALDSGPDGKALAGSLVATYFRLFDAIVGDRAKNLQDGELLQSRLLSALLTGASCLFNEFGLLACSLSFLLFLSSFLEAVPSVAHASFLVLSTPRRGALPTGVNRARPFLSERDRALEGHVDTLYRVAHTATPAARTQAFLLLFHVAVGTASEADVASGSPRHRTAADEDDGEGDDGRGKRRDRFYRALYSTLSDSAMLGGGKHLTMFFNLLYKALKHDPDGGRVLAFVKRLLSAALHCPSPVSAASIFLVNEIAKHHPNLPPCLAEPLDGPDALRVLDPTKREPRGAIVVKDDGGGEAVGNNGDTKAGIWEVALFQHHYHPSVAMFAKCVGDAETFSYGGDPLRDFGLQPFLDKFSYRNPKSAERVASKFRKPGEHGTVGQRKGTGDASRLSSFPVNDPSFLQQQDVAVHDEFFRKFFVERARRDELKGIDRHKAGSGSNDNDERAEHLTAEQSALNEAEDWDGSKRFEDWERAWETDPEEEAFVDSLTQRIIEDSVGAHGPDELDDEDPDMDGWSDMHSDEDDDGDVEDLSDQGEAQDNAIKVTNISAENDGFIDESVSTSDDSDAEVGLGFLDGEEAVTSFVGHGSANDDEETDSSEESGDNDINLLDKWEEEDDDDDDVQEHGEELDRKEAVDIRSNRKKQKVRSTFVDLEEYEDRINESWLSLNRPEQDNTGKKETKTFQQKRK